MSRDYEGHLYPAPNVSKQTQSWTCAIERKINKLEQRTSDAIVSANHAANRSYRTGHGCSTCAP